jgi:hypothetical protein
MLNLSATTHVVRLVIAAAANIDCHASWVDLNTSTGAITPDALPTPNTTTATTITVVPAPATGVVRNVKALYVTNTHASAATRVACEIFDGTNPVEIIGFILLPGENMTFNEEGKWAHRDAQGAEYPPAGKGAYDGNSYTFMKTGTAPEAAANWYCTSKDGGFPGAWAPGTPGLSGRATDGTGVGDTGCIPIKNPAVGANYLTALEMAASVNHTHQFFDVLWVNSGLVVTTTTAQTVNSATLPARDINGTTNGEGCMIAMLFVAAATNAAAIANATVSYTNSDGTAGRTATLSAIAGSQIPATPVIGTLVWFNLAAGDKGVRSIQSVTLGTSLVTGTVSMMITRDLATMGTPIPNVSTPKVISAPGIRLYNNTCALHCVLASAATATFFSGELVVTEK